MFYFDEHEPNEWERHHLREMVKNKAFSVMPSIRRAILMYEDRVNILKQAKTETEQLLFEISKRYSFTFETTDGSLLEESEVILNNLKERK